MAAPWALRVAFALPGCIGGEPDTPPVDAQEGEAGPAEQDPDAGWIWLVATDPAGFGARIDGARPGWIALHANRLHDAVEAFADEPVGRARAELALGLLHTDLAALTGRVADDLYSSWEARGTLPPGEEIPLVAALAAWCARGESASRWAGRVTQGPDEPIAQALIQGRSPFEVATNGPFGKRMAVHQQVRTTGDPAALLAVAGQPVSTVQEADFVREFWDPCVHRTLSDLWIDRAVRDATTVSPPRGGGAQPVQPVDGGRWRKLDLMASSGDIGALVFGPWPTAADLTADLATAESLGVVGANAPSLRRIGVGTATFPTDDPEAARQEVRLLDAGLDALQRRISDLGDAEGATVVNDLGLVHRFRQEWLVVRARRFLADRQPRSALTLLELARDHAERSLGPRNSPSLFALTALARLQLGHTREALDALHVLAQVHPEVKGIVEVTGELAVLQGLDRSGDSKEE